MSATTDLMTANLFEVFGERDAAARRLAIERVFAPDVVFHDAEGDEHGHDGIDGKVAGLLAGAPADWVFAVESPAVEVADLGRVGWSFGPPGAPVVHGMDIALVSSGRITTIWTVVEPS